MPNLRKAMGRQNKKRFIRKSRKTCKCCGRRRALFVRKVRAGRNGKTRLGKRAVVKTDKDHVLCQQCHRAQADSQYSQQRYGGQR